MNKDSIDTIIEIGGLITIVIGYVLVALWWGGILK